MQTICKVCGSPVEVPFASTGHAALDSAMLKLAGNLVHADCKRKQAEHERKERTAHNQAEQLAKRMSEWAGVCPPLYQDTDESRLPAVFKRVMAWVYNPIGLCIGGPTSTCKTRMMFSLCKREFFNSKAVVAMTHTQFAYSAIHNALAQRDSAEQWMRIITGCDILFIDDLGKARFVTNEGTSKHGEELLWHVLEHRWTHKLPCMFTMNATGGELAGKMSRDVANPFLRRLREFCEVISVQTK